MATATRTMRPFRGLSALSSLFDDSVLTFGPDACQSNRRVHSDLHPHEFMIRNVSIDWAADESGFTRFKARVRNGLGTAELEPVHVEIVVLVQSSYLKLSDIAFRSPVSELDSLPRRVEIPRSQARALSAPFSGFQVVIALVLSDTLPRAPLKPYRKGTWLTKASFGVDTRLSQVLFSPVPLTEEIRNALQIGKKATRFVDLDGYDVMQPTEGQDEPKFYVDADLLAQLNVRRSSAVSYALQAQLAVDFVSAIVRQAHLSENRGIGFEEIEASLLGRVVRMLAGEDANKAKADQTLSAILDNPVQAIANIEHAFNVSKLLNDALKSEDE